MNGISFRNMISTYVIIRMRSLGWTPVLIRRRKCVHTHGGMNAMQGNRQREEGHVQLQVESGVMLSHPRKNCEYQKLEVARKDPVLESSGEHCSANALMADFQPPLLRE